jgi:hypothetical protein
MEHNGNEKLVFHDDSTPCNDRSFDSNPLAPNPYLPAGTYSWTYIEIRQRADGYVTTYTPDGKVKDHDGNIVDTHNLSIPDIVLSASQSSATLRWTPKTGQVAKLQSGS